MKGCTEMIIDNIKNAKLYYALGENFKKGFMFLEGLDASEQFSSPYEIDGENVYANISQYTQRPDSECKWEGHRKYADIQFVIKGCELMGYVPRDRAVSSSPYDADGDAEFFDAEGTIMRAEEGDFIIFMPDDIHRPGIAPQPGSEVVKAVVKVKVS